MSHVLSMRVLCAQGAAALLSAGHAYASQGPGTLPGTASPFTQMAMAIVVYGLCAITIAAGVIGSFRRNWPPAGRQPLQ
jgi:hypothetical protein